MSKYTTSYFQTQRAAENLSTDNFTFWCNVGAFFLVGLYLVW